MSPRRKASKRPDFSALGKISTPAKRRAAKANGKRGGRKPKFAIGDRARANNQAPSDYRGRIGVITEIGPGKSEFRVDYEDGGPRFARFGYLMSWWLDREK